MFDATGAFIRQFTPVDGGYVFYPSRKSGGKLVTFEEYEALVTNWRRVAGWRSHWKVAGIVFLVILLWTLASQALALPDSADWLVIVACVAALSGWVLWASFAPHRLVKDRPDYTPPRAAWQTRREARAALNWPLVIVVLLFSGAVFLGHLAAPNGTLAWWAWIIGSGLFFGGYLWIAIQKIADRQR